MHQITKYGGLEEWNDLNITTLLCPFQDLVILHCALLWLSTMALRSPGTTYEIYRFLHFQTNRENPIKIGIIVSEKFPWKSDHKIIVSAFPSVDINSPPWKCSTQGHQIRPEHGLGLPIGRPFLCGLSRTLA